MPRLVVTVLAAAFCLLSCTVNQVLSISADGSGTLSTHAEVAPILRDYLISLAEVSGADSAAGKGQVFDAAAIRKDMQARAGLTVLRAVTPTASSLDLDLGFDSLGDALRGQGALADAGAITLVDGGDRSTLKLRLDRSTYGQLSALFPPLRDPVIQQLGPQGTGTVSESDYLEMIRFSIGDEAPGLLKKSYFTLTVRPAGEILSQVGGTIADGAVIFRIPVLRVLMLDRALEYSVTYRTGGP
ncbi:MAG TPA: hypothetical protein VL359_01545 [bacterium]|nr:hypothetical protein [bacterium]